MLYFLSWLLIYLTGSIVVAGPRLIHQVLHVPIHCVKDLFLRLAGYCLVHFVGKFEVKKVAGWWYRAKVTLWLSWIIWTLRVNRQVWQLFLIHQVSWKLGFVEQARNLRVIPYWLHRVRLFSVGYGSYRQW